MAKFKLSDLFNMNSEDKETSTMDQKPVWSDEVIKGTDDSAFNNKPKGSGDKYSDGDFN